MNNKFFKAAAAGIILSISALTNIANAGLIDRGNGMIYDDVQDITWLQDANYAMTSGYHADGLMNWHESVAWVDQLSFGGFEDWRLHNAAPGDENCMFGSGDANYGANCYKNELVHMMHYDFGLVGTQSIDAAVGDAEYELFTNLHASGYWSGNTLSLNSAVAWDFGAYSNSQGWHRKNDNYSYAWAVRDGDVGAVDATVPEPATLAMFCLGWLGLVMRKRAN